MITPGQLATLTAVKIDTSPTTQAIINQAGRMTTPRSLVMPVLIGIALAIGVALAPLAHAGGPYHDPSDPAHGTDCVDMGKRVCAPNNLQHAPAGCYDDGGVLVSTWPCSPWKPSDGWRHPHGPATYPNSAPLGCISSSSRICSLPARPHDHDCYDDLGRKVATEPCYYVIDPRSGDASIFKGYPGKLA